MSMKVRMMDMLAGIEEDDERRAELGDGYIPLGSPDDWPEGDARKGEDNVDGWSSRKSTLHSGNGGYFMGSWG